ncbi:MAG TPA: RhoGEF domain-containing protein, partial [archaeon]|nr:RhoGEF domain-containing protein [archaeon]
EPGSPPYDELLAALQYVLGELKPFHAVGGDGGRKSARGTLSKHQFADLFAAVERIFGDSHPAGGAGEAPSHRRAISFALERAAAPSSPERGELPRRPNPVPVVLPPGVEGAGAEKDKKKNKKGVLSMHRSGTKSSSARVKTSTVRKPPVEMHRVDDSEAAAAGTVAASPSAAPLRRWAQRAQVSHSVSSSDREALKRLLEDRYKALLEQLSNDDVSVAEDTDADEEELEYDELPDEISSVLLAVASRGQTSGHPAATGGDGNEAGAPLTDEQHATKTREEFIITEGRYVASLRVLIREYMLPLRKSGILSEGTVATVFSNIKTIYRMHLELFRDLSAKDGRPVVNFTDQLGLFVPYLKLYTIYVNN